MPRHRPAQGASARVGPVDGQRRAGQVLRRMRRRIRRFRRGQAAGRVLRGVRRRGIRGAGAHNRRVAGLGGAGAGRRETRRHRLDDGGIRRRLGGRFAAGRRRGDRLALSRIRFPSAASRHRRGPWSRRLRAGRHVQPRGRQRPASQDRRWHRRAVDRRRRRRGNRESSPEPGSVGVVVGATLSDPPDLSALRGPVLVPGVGAQGGRPEALGGFGGAHPGQLLPAVSREVLRAGPEVAALRAAAERFRDAVAYLA